MSAWRDSVSLRPVKFALSLLILAAFSLSLCGCDTLANRRSLFAPNYNEGYWTRTLDERTWRERGLSPEEKDRAEYKRKRLWGDPEQKMPMP